MANSGSSSGLIPYAKALAEYPLGKPDPSSLWIIGVFINVSGRFAPDGIHIKCELD
jgi:hypothetical protein